MSSFYLAVPVRNLFFEATASYSVVLRKTLLDHTDVMELALEYWDLLEDITGNREELHALAEQKVVTYYRRLKPSYTVVQSVAYALRQLLECAYEFFYVWVRIARMHFDIRRVESIRATTYLSASTVVLEIKA